LKWNWSQESSGLVLVGASTTHCCSLSYRQPLTSAAIHDNPPFRPRQTQKPIHTNCTTRQKPKQKPASDASLHFRWPMKRKIHRQAVTRNSYEKCVVLSKSKHSHSEWFNETASFLCPSSLRRSKFGCPLFRSLPYHRNGGFLSRIRLQ